MPQGRRSRLIIRRVDPWTVLKFSALLYLSTYFVVLVAGVVLWSVATATGVRGNIESFVGELIASERFEFKADQILRSSIIGGGVLVVVGTFANVLMSVLFNLISDVVGGIGISVEEKPPKRRKSRERSRKEGVTRDGQPDASRPQPEPRRSPIASLVRRARE
ncbi:MAG: DUF3566 domain-containing protein [Acidimicrobiales bacterium]|nr:DUF3566 domain-containing protein [Actinomycetota bacterium]